MVWCLWSWEACVCRVWCECKDETCFFRNKDSKRVWLTTHWLKVEPKQSIFFFSIDISFLIKEEVEHAIGELGEAILAWQTCESILFFKDSFFFKQTSKSFEMEAIFIFKESFSFKTKSSFEDKISFFFKTSLQSFLFFKISFSFRASQVWISMNPFY